jgi:hypothetical protein
MQIVIDVVIEVVREVYGAGAGSPRQHCKPHALCVDRARATASQAWPRHGVPTYADVC